MLVLYIDPGTGSMLISATIALFSVAFFMLKGVIYRKFSIGGDKGEALDPSKKYGLVFYSEGKQYWNVFQPLVEEASRRNIPATYFTSDKEDPGLTANLEGIEAKFIGSGREAYYVLNRLNADVVVMTTPGLDVLEIKRSKNVKHYVHVTHSAGGVSGYKSYGTDYFDSVLVGGDGDFGVVRELESKRNIDPKEIEIIGHTYLDVMRQDLTNNDYEYTIFEEKRPTILLSPTWGNHGLLMKFGDELLSKLEESDKFNIIIRPHPQSFISEAQLMEDLMTKYPNNAHRVWNRDVQNLKAMAHADIMISDFSGIIYDFYALFKKPILTMNSQFEKRGRDAMDLDEDSWDIKMLDEIGRTIYDSDIPNLLSIIDETLSQSNEKQLEKTSTQSEKYPGEAGVRGMDFISEKLVEVQSVSTSSEVPSESSQPLLNDNYTFNKHAEGVSGNAFIKFIKAIFNSNMLIQLAMGLALLVGYTYLGKKFLPEGGLNSLFLIGIISKLVMITIGFLVLFLLFTWIQGKGKISLQKQSEPIDWKDLFFIALPMTPIIQYIIANQDILDFKSSVLVFATFALVAAIAIVLLPWFMSTVLAKDVSVAVTMSFLFIVFNMASFGKVTEPKTIFWILLGLCLAIFLILFLDKKKLLIIISLIFFVTNFVTSVTKGSNNEKEFVNETTEYNTRIAEMTEGKEVKHTPDVYIIIYDAYSSQQTLDAYGIDHSEQFNYMLDNGFAVYDGAYSIGPYSVISMAHLLNPQLIPDSFTEYRKMLAGDGSAVQKLNELGYFTNTVHDSDYMIKDMEPKYDFTFPDKNSSIAPHKIINQAILEGEFRFDAEFSEITFQDYMDTKRKVLSANKKDPEFLYAHGSNPGHTQNSGVLTQADYDQHVAALQSANVEMRDDFDALNIKNRDDAIVIIAGDHGPYLTKTGIGLADFPLSEINRLDIQDRYGALLAIHWPKGVDPRRFDIKTVQDALPAVIAYMYDDDELFDQIRMSRDILAPHTVGEANVIDGIIVGGPNDGEPLYLDQKVRFKNSN